MSNTLAPENPVVKTPRRRGKKRELSQFGRPYMRPAHIEPYQNWADDDHRAEIDAAVLAEKPPPRWFAVGPPDSPRPLAYLPSRAYYEWYWQRGIDPDSRRAGLPQAVRDFIKERDEMVCGICGYFVPDDECHIDHIHPVVAGGSDRLDNLRVSHARCNLAKGAKI